MNFTLSASEMAELFKQDPHTREDGGFQGLLVALQGACNQKTGVISLTVRQRERIRMYAFKYGNGGWENRLVAAFGHHLGPKLDLGLPPPDWI